jgi:hypothetical protein
MHIGGTLVGRASRDITIVDLSRGGCLVQCDALLDSGAILDLRFQLGPDPFAAKVRVTDSSRDGAAAGASPRYLAGLQFLSLPVQQESRLVRFLEEERRRRRAHTPSD